MQQRAKTILMTCSKMTSALTLDVLAHLTGDVVKGSEVVHLEDIILATGNCNQPVALYAANSDGKCRDLFVFSIVVRSLDVRTIIAIRDHDHDIWEAWPIPIRSDETILNSFEHSLRKTTRVLLLWASC